MEITKNDLKVGTLLGYISRGRTIDSNEEKFILTTGKITSIYLGQRKQTVKIKNFRPQDLEDLLYDLNDWEECCNGKHSMMIVDQFFLATEENIKHVNKWIEWANSCKNKEWSIWSHLEEGDNND